MSKSTEIRPSTLARVADRLRNRIVWCGRDVTELTGVRACRCSVCDNDRDALAEVDAILTKMEGGES